MWPKPILNQPTRTRHPISTNLHQTSLPHHPAFTHFFTLLLHHQACHDIKAPTAKTCLFNSVIFQLFIFSPNTNMQISEILSRLRINWYCSVACVFCVMLQKVNKSADATSNINYGELRHRKTVFTPIT